MAGTSTGRKRKNRRYQCRETVSGYSFSDYEIRPGEFDIEPTASTRRIGSEDLEGDTEPLMLRTTYMTSAFRVSAEPVTSLS